MILTKLLFEHFCTLSYFTTCSILIVRSVLHISFPYVYTLVYRSSFTGGCHSLWGCPCILSSGSLVCTFLCASCGTYGLRCSLLWWYTTPSGVWTLYDWWPRYSWIMAGYHLFSGYEHDMRAYWQDVVMLSLFIFILLYQHFQIYFGFPLPLR